MGGLAINADQSALLLASWVQLRGALSSTLSAGAPARQRLRGDIYILHSRGAQVGLSLAPPGR